ncbi:bifunctional diaminohydroxyphosphoribosylaminopyrimidine deaminase/5-amino-6-(5-phosphoribosylamino)uracil reductase RibD [Gymnodinialimonas ceratoperidinii]|uniref:Riboflavin biosynthesis protein RibD n=1 Tax=Gymnodinialimonas ceratoperidinii TaxID=2856823 RepID=A0A8F6TZ78_9RHOB|nr:bifunctional diaminohydroxyphosphoribosylaminopyrimidine deaminase/5-amino-6-(5-phosphoribosylamino)uracil reductase RibD [Gymnodinialimonas ceratoperidinii]QXT40709.1 bifunctional diaminohydroxyphosphoribosylaminopyrimidine deaminase/5-amino-6-(5-phosphoribosylamino)uracil reductase RibD [Gymnodinialimonas ceratoperidinii]
MSDARWMALALSLGARGLGKVWPNPAVGCVLVRDGRVVGRGATAPGGRPHAEVVALRQAGDAARGACAYVSLEPCNHTGQTGPCAQALIDAGVARVVVGCGDPDPRVAGGGIARMRDAGIEVVTGVCEAEALRVHEGFLSRVREGRPMVTLKVATSLDGRIATASGESQWITGPEARRRVHWMRGRHDAVMVGAGTARADDPALTVRGMGDVAQPVRVVISRRLGLPVDSVLGRSAREVPVWLVHGPDAPAAAREAWSAVGARLLEVTPDASGQVDADAALRRLGDEGLTRVFCEGGGALAASLLAADAVDRLAVFSGGVMLGAEGTPSVGAMGIAALAEAPRFALERVEQLGPDALSLWRRHT